MNVFKNTMNRYNGIVNTGSTKPAREIKSERETDMKKTTSVAAITSIRTNLRSKKEILSLILT